MNLQGNVPNIFASPPVEETDMGLPKEAIERLRDSRAEYLRKVLADGRETGARWLRDEASYEQIKRIVRLKANGHAGDAFARLDAGNPLKRVEESAIRLSAMPDWARDRRWFESFVESAVAEWGKIADEVETDA